MPSASARAIMHEEMPQQREGLLDGLQLWVNLPAKQKMMPPRYQDVPAAPIPTAFAHVFEGEGAFGVADQEGGEAVTHPRLVVFGDGDHVKVHTTDHRVRFLLISGQPIGEPIARYGPFVMNTREEIQQTLKELREGTFV